MIYSRVIASPENNTLSISSQYASQIFCSNENSSEVFEIYQNDSTELNYFKVCQILDGDLDIQV